MENNINFLDAYKPPYYIDEGDNQVCAQDNPKHGLVMAWNWIDNEITGKRYVLNDIKKNIVKKVNGEPVNLGIKFNKGADPVTIYSDQVPIMCIRGWGMLTGYPFRLKSEEAIKIQDDFINYIIEKCNETSKIRSSN